MRFLLPAALLALPLLATAEDPPPAPAGTPAAAEVPAAAPTGAPGEAAPAAAPAPAEKDEKPPLLTGRTPDEDEEARAVSEAVRAYEEESKEFRREVQLLIEKKYGERRSLLETSYERQIKDFEVGERKERLDAIAIFEEFLSRYPDEPGYSPDVMFRLAELYYEKTKDDVALAMNAYEEKLKNLGEGVEAPPAPQPDYSQSIALYDRLIEKFPDYKLLDAAWYLKAYCLEQSSQPEPSRAAYLTLIDRYPDSRFVPEAWVRIGEYWFENTEGDVTENLQKAAAAYTRMLAFPDHALYDKALYKLGWTYYRMDDYDQAVGSFVQLLDFYEKKRADSGDEKAFGDLYEEAMQYTAISFTDDDWGGVPKAEAWFQKIGGRPYEGKVYKRIGDILYDIQKKDDRGYPLAVDAYRLALARDPLDPQAPQVQARIVAALSRERLFDQETKEREKLVENYSEGGKWFEANKNNPDVTAAALALAEQALKVAATFHHTQAQQYKKDGKLLEAFSEYQVAAKAYGDYLARFPHSKEVYDLTFAHADCLYNSLDFLGAAREYTAVRDMQGETTYLAEAAYSTVLAYQKAMEKDIKEGKLAEPQALTAKERGEVDSLSAKPMPEAFQRFIAAADVYDQKVPADQNTPAVMFKAGELYYAYDDFPEARRRFDSIIGRFPKDPVAQSAANLIIESYLITKDWVNVQLATSKFLDQKDLQLDPELKANLYTFKLGAIYKQADKLMADGKFEEASTEYLKLVAEKPDHEFADKALNNAAVCFENSNRFDTAMKTYERIIAEYPRSTFADAALFRVAENARKSYDFDKAVGNYERLVRDYPQSKERANALNNLAVLLVGLQRYDEGARAYQKYAQLYPNEPDAPRNQYQAALIYERTEDWRRLVSSLDAFVGKFGGNPKQNDLVVQAELKIAKAQEKLKNGKAATSAYERCTSEYDRRFAGKAAPAAASAAAAECAFQLADDDFDAWDRLRIEGSKKVLEASFKRKKDGVPKLKSRYLEVARYKNVDWTLAAFYRKAYVLERLANALYEAPIPPEVKRLGFEAEDLYRGKLAEMVVQVEDQAVKEYQETLDQARAFGIANEWTRRTLESLNRYRPKEYPILKEARVEFQDKHLLPAGLAPEPGGFPVAQAPEAPPAPQGPEGSPPPPSAAPGPGSDLGKGGVKAAPPPPESGKVGK